MRQLVRHLAPAVFLATLLVPLVAVACLWDYDTIKMERSRFPGTLELITGKFLRHSPEFYEWRIRDRLKRLESSPADAALLDDLAVAYDKTGQHDKAIETALRTEKLHPGRYETAANFGTFYLHAGKPEEGVAHIGRALKINSDAHFGREKYQKLLAEYVTARRRGGPLVLPLAEVKLYAGTVPESPSARGATVSATFADYLHKGPDGPLTPETTSAAVKGVLGMMKFGKHDSPVLLEALGSLLVRDGDRPDKDAKLLAARAFLRASYEVPEGPARVSYRAMAANALDMQTPRPDEETQVSLKAVEADFTRELADARAWYAELREHELSWIREGRDPEAEFDLLYATEPTLSGMDVVDPRSARETVNRRIIAGIVVLMLVPVAILVALTLLLRRISRRRPTPVAAGKV